MYTFICDFSLEENYNQITEMDFESGSIWNLWE